jgi:hypothetical protein
MYPELPGVEAATVAAAVAAAKAYRLWKEVHF